MSRHDFMPKDELVIDYRRVFTSRGSDDVILHSLFDDGVFEEAEKPEDMTLRNRGIRMLKIIGGGYIGRDAIVAFVKALANQPLKGGKKK